MPEAGGQLGRRLAGRLRRSRWRDLVERLGRELRLEDGRVERREQQKRGAQNRDGEVEVGTLVADGLRDGCACDTQRDGVWGRGGQRGARAIAGA